MNIPESIQDINSKFLWLLAAGFCGSLVGLGINNATFNTPMKRCLYLFGGVCSAFFLAGPVAKHFGLTEPGEIASVGFGVSVFWNQIMVKLSSTIDNFSIPFFNGGKKDGSV